MKSEILKGITSIGIICLDGVRLSPVAAVIMRDLLVKSKKSAVRSISVEDAGHKRTSSKVSNSSKGFLQQRGFGTTAFLEPKRVDKYWLKTKDLVLTMDRFIRRDILRDFYPTKKAEVEGHFLILNDAAGIRDKIRDPGDEVNAGIEDVFLLIEECVKKIVKKIEAVN